MRAISLLFLYLILATPMFPQVVDVPARTFSARDLFGLRIAADPQVRPDGGAIAYVRETYDISNDNSQPSIWLVDPATGAQSPLVVDENANSSPRWSPDGQRLAYVVNTPGKPPQLYVRWIANGRSARVANLEQAPNSIAWSPDGKTLAFTMLMLDEGKPLAPPLPKPEGARWAEPLKQIDRVTYRADGQGYLKPGYRHIFAVSADGGTPRQITFGRFDDRGPIAFDSDGQSVLFATNRADNWERDPNESDIYRVSISEGTLTRLTRRVGPDQSPAVSPDGTKIAYTGYDDRQRSYENTGLYVMNRDGSNSRLLTASLDRSITNPRWAPDSRSIYISYVDHGVTKIANVQLDGRLETIAAGLAAAGELDRPYSGGQFSVGRNGLIAYTQGAPDQPPDVAVAQSGKTRRLTHLNDDLFAGKTLASVEAIPVVSSFDKLPIDAWIVRPPKFDASRKYPLILEIHGGPFSSYGPT